MSAAIFLTLFSSPCHAAKLQTTGPFPVPILVYHGVFKEKKDTKWSMTNREFENQMSFLVNNGYEVIAVSDLLEAWEHHKVLPPHSVVLTFDDTYADHYRVVFPLLKKYQLKATIFIVTNSIGQKDCLTWEQVEEMDRSKIIDFAIHSNHHINLRSVPLAQAKREMGEAKGLLEQKLNRPIVTMSYPYGSHSENVKKAAKEVGFKLAFTLHPGFADQSQNPMDLHRIPITTKTKLPYVLSNYYYRLHHTLDYLRAKDF
jgi:peptidoglycan/xylan/chitin deacetylase (PgdA/CDA1 family)